MKHFRGRKHRKSNIEKLKDRSFLKYMSWKKVYCPAIKKDVSFTRAGWNHLCVTKYRTDVELKKRLQILPLTKKLIETTTTIQVIRNDGYLTYEFNAMMDGIRVVAVISWTNTGWIYWTTFRD